jgi:hypothetical protein
MSKPISRLMLVHSATLNAYIGTVNSVKTYGTNQALTFVRLEPTKQNAMTSLGDMKNDRFTLFYDCVNSRPLAVSFAIGDKITFGGSVLFVRKAAACYADSSSTHHWEVACV